MTNSYLLFYCLILIKFNDVQTQFSEVTYVNPTSCASNQYFDISQLKCLSCPTNSKKDSTGLSV